MTHMCFVVCWHMNFVSVGWTSCACACHRRLFLCVVGPDYQCYCLISFGLRAWFCVIRFPIFPSLFRFDFLSSTPGMLDDLRHARHPLRGHARPRGGRPVRAGGRGPGQPRRWPGAAPRVAVPLGGLTLPRGRRRGSPARRTDPGRLCRALRAWRRSPARRVAVSRVSRAKFFLPPSLRYVPSMLGFVCCLIQFVCWCLMPLSSFQIWFVCPLVCDFCVVLFVV